MTTESWMLCANASEKWLRQERYCRGSFKEEHIDYSDYQDFDDAQRQLAHWLEVEYMTERVHSALDYLTPAEFETLALNPSESRPLRA